MNIGEAAARSGVTAKTIRYYESIGLIGQADRRGNNYRTYSDGDISTLSFIARARSLGFSVKEVGQLLTLWRDRKRTSRAVKTLALGQMAEIDRKIAELQSVRRAIEKLTDCCQGDERPDCPILEDLARPASQSSHIAR